LLLGTSMWYAFYGATLSSESAFESRVDSLARELGGRGRADSKASSDGRDELVPEPAPEREPAGSKGAESSGSGGAVRTTETTPAVDLQGLKVSALKKRAVSIGATERQLEEADDADDVKAYLIDLIVREASLAAAAVAASASDRAQSLRAELEGLKVSALKKRAASSGVAPEVLLEADDADDVKGSVIDLILRAEGVGGA
jgi:hypothetical protein